MPTGDDVLLVTGGSRGIGAAVARGAADAGWSVCLTYRSDQAAAASVAADVRDRGVAVEVVRCDMALEPDIVAAFSAAAAMGRLAAVVVNAGIVAPEGVLADVTAERIATLFQVNVLGPILCCREAVRRMSRSRGGSGGAIVLVSSAASRLGSPGEYVDYAATKGAIDTLGLGLAREVAADGVRVNVVRPGLVDTGIHASMGRPDRAATLAPTIPMGRPAQPEEVARAILWLSGEQSGYCTGSILDVTGGR